MAAKQSRGVWLMGLIAVVIAAALLRQLIAGDVARLIAQLWISCMDAVMRLLAPLFGF